jgi:hypothetical protein
VKINTISGAKNEANIVESFVQHSSKFIYDIYRIDRLIDGMLQISQQLADEFYRISKIHSDIQDYQLSKAMTYATRLINQNNQYDWNFLPEAAEIFGSAKRIFTRRDLSIQAVIESAKHNAD